MKSCKSANGKRNKDGEKKPVPLCVKADQSIIHLQQRQRSLFGSVFFLHNKKPCSLCDLAVGVF